MGLHPQELLNNLTPVYTNGATNPKQYALDGNVKALKYDANGDGVVESGDRVLLFFGQGRGGSSYYALDVTDKTKPKFLWTIGNGTAGFWLSARSTPVITRVNIGTVSQNSQQLALVFAAAMTRPRKALVSDEQFRRQRGLHRRCRQRLAALVGRRQCQPGEPEAFADGSFDPERRQRDRPRR